MRVLEKKSGPSCCRLILLIVLLLNCGWQALALAGSSSGGGALKTNGNLPCIVSAAVRSPSTSISTNEAQRRDGDDSNDAAPLYITDQRRSLLKSTASVAAAVAFLPTTTCWTLPAMAATPSRQLELCLVSVARVLFWAQASAQRLSNAAKQDPDLEKQAYLQVRLGAKAVLTGKIGGGATGTVYTLSTLQIPGCLKDMQLYANSSSSRKTGSPKPFDDLKTDWTEALAAVVEFDGLDTLTDPSPRSLLILQQFTPNKAVFVRRLLVERVIPVGRQMLQCFPEEARKRSREYALQYYANEMVVGEPSVF